MDYGPIVKRCSLCHHWYSLCRFNRNRAGRYGRHNMCKPCHVANNRRWPRGRRPGDNLMRDYGINETCYQAMLHAQRGVCAICGRVDADKRLAVDHDHETGAIRGLLCHLCNRGIGQLGDSAERLRAAADYLDGAPFRDAELMQRFTEYAEAHQ